MPNQQEIPTTYSVSPEDKLEETTQLNLEELPSLAVEESKRFQNVAPTISFKKCLVVTDMTGTLLFQSADHSRFSENLQHLLTELIDQGGKFFLISGDSTETVTDQFVAVLNYQGEGTFYLAPISGHELHQVTKESTECLYKGPSVPRESRVAFLNRIEVLIREEYGDPSFHLSEKEKEVFFETGTRIDIKEKIKGRSDTFFLEMIYAKGGVYFPEKKTGVNGDQDAQFLRRLSMDAEVVATANECGLNMIAGGDYVDLIATTKDQGVDIFLDKVELSEDIDTILLIGDSRNDKGIFNRSYPSHLRVFKIFVGKDAELVDNELDRAENPDFFYLEGTYTKGTEEVFEMIASHQPSAGMN